MVGRKRSLPENGDTFAFKLDNGMYGCCRVLRFSSKKPEDKWSCDAVLVACCEWIGSSIPNVDETDLTPILHLTHHKWNSSCISWVTSSVTESYVYIGKTKPSATELNLKCDSTVKWPFFQIQRLSQYVWDNQIDNS